MADKILTVQQTQQTTEQEQSLHDLFECLSQRLSREAVFFVNRNKTFEPIIKKYKPDAVVQDIKSIDDLQNKKFRNVVLMEVLENFEQRLGNEILDKAWQLLKKKGRLIVIVPNEDVYQHPFQIRQFKHNKLKKTLTTFNHPKMIKEQPFKWLAMYVQKCPAKEKNNTITKRMDIMAKRCQGKVIEFGCGRGLLTKKVHDLGLVVIGVDISGRKIAEARKNFPEIDFIQADVLELPLPTNSFDTVLLPEILEHVLEKSGDKMLYKAWKILKPGGRLIVSVPNNQCIPSQNHIRLFTRGSLSTLLESFGKPKIVTEQPYKWLTMYVDKPLGDYSFRLSKSP